MIITQTPLRISLLGGNTDFPAYFKKHGGAVLTTTIDKHIYCIVKKRFDNEIWINYSIKEKVNKVDDIKHDLVREAMKLIGVTEGIEITFLSDIPSEGSGLGSSSACVIGLLNALHAYKNENVTARQLAEEACRIEINALSRPIGVQDQYAVAFGGFNLIEFGEEIKITQMEPDILADSLMLLYTGITRKTVDILSNMKLDKEILDKTKEIVYKKLDTITDPIIIGDLMDRHWALKRELNPFTSNDLIDVWYAKALEAGAFGGKVVGAGGGGFLLLSTPSENRQAIKEITRLRELPFKFSRYGSRIIFNTHE